MNAIDNAKAEFNRIAKAHLREELCRKSWPEKIAAVERLNALQRTLRASRARAPAR